MALLLSLLCSALLAVAEITGQEQQQLLSKKEKDLIYELKLAEIIPTVIDEFVPTLALSISWENVTAEIGNTVPPSDVQEAPEVHFMADTSSTYKHKHMQYTIALSDPDAPSRDNPEWSEMCHWIATNIKLDHPNEDLDDDQTLTTTTSYREVMPWKPPGPPPKTGKHRYVFIALVPKNGTHERLHLEKPGDRQHWGFKHERNGLRMWAESQGLVVVGANFIYAQNEKQ